MWGRFRRAFAPRTILRGRLLAFSTSSTATRLCEPAAFCPRRLLLLWHSHSWLCSWVTHSFVGAACLPQASFRSAFAPRNRRLLMGGKHALLPTIVIDCWDQMNSGQWIVALWLLVPVVLVSLVWWSWARGHGAGKRWRRSATLLSATATTANSVLMAAMLLWATISQIAPATAHRSLFFSLLLLGFGTSIVSSVVVVFGTGWLRWLIVPASALQGFTWSLLAHIATLPLFPG
jgi:hypothetical protein